MRFNYHLFRFTFRLFIASVCVAAILVPGPARSETVFDPTADFAAGFNSGTNPNGVWTYGSSSTLASAIELDTLPTVSTFTEGGVNYSSNTWYDPAIPAGPVFQFLGPPLNDGNVVFPTGLLGFTPLGSGYIHLSFTAPATADYAIAMTFTGRQYNINSDVHILSGGNSLLSGLILAIGQTQSYSGTQHLNAGETIDFAVGPGTVAGSHPTILSLAGTITESNVTATPVPSTLVMSSILFWMFGTVWSYKRLKRIPAA